MAVASAYRDRLARVREERAERDLCAERVLEREQRYRHRYDERAWRVLVTVLESLGYELVDVR